LPSIGITQIMIIKDKDNIIIDKKIATNCIIIYS
jgi:hypothetical protein